MPSSLFPAARRARRRGGGVRRFRWDRVRQDVGARASRHRIDGMRRSPRVARLSMRARVREWRLVVRSDSQDKATVQRVSRAVSALLQERGAVTRGSRACGLQARCLCEVRREADACAHSRGRCGRALRGVREFRTQGGGRNSRSALPPRAFSGGRSRRMAFPGCRQIACSIGRFCGDSSRATAASSVANAFAAARSSGTAVISQYSPRSSGPSA